MAYQMGILIPSQDAGRLIGKAGAGLKQVREMSQCQVKLGSDPDSQQNRRCDIGGPTVEHIASAVHAIGLRLFEGPSASVKMMVAFPNDYVGGIIGKGAANLKHIRESTGVGLTLEKGAMSDQGDRVGQLVGVRDQLGAAIRIALNGVSAAGGQPAPRQAPRPANSYTPMQTMRPPVSEWPQRAKPPNVAAGNMGMNMGMNNASSSLTQVRRASGDPNEMQVHMQIPPKYIGPILGKEGAQIKQIVTESGCANVSVTKREAGSQERRVVFVGGFDECARAQQSVYQIYAGAAAEAGEEASLTCFMMVPTTSAGAVIGKQGANLKELRETLSLKVILSKEEIEGFRPCTLSGALDSILEAERRIQEQIVSPDGPPPSNGGVKRLLDAPEPEPFENKSHGTFISAYSEPEAKRPRPSAAAPRTTSESTKILVPANVAGAIIGKQGSTLKQIRESSGASIDVVKETQTPEFPGERVVNVRGSLDVRRNALPQVLTAAFEKDPANALIKMMVPSNLVGGIIGRQGANLKAIREQCGIHVQVGQKDQQTVHGERMVFATGGLEQVLSAAALVLDSAEAAAAPKSAVAGAFPEAME